MLFAAYSYQGNGRRIKPASQDTLRTALATADPDAMTMTGRGLLLADVLADHWVRSLARPPAGPWAE
ncbi:hypothetical protein GCM10010300_78260 [Streptomyces olivaceoviridis]|nr:hypothetical protein GCM10010300_78260 [Streptomyces olivaceoviridis]